MYNQTKMMTTFLLLLLPTLVFANAGSTLLWFGILHSFILNAFIGLAESAVVNKYKMPNRTWLIIFANYISMFVGLYLIAPYFTTIIGNYHFWNGDNSVGEYKTLGFIIGMVVSFLATLIIEFPFFYLAVKDKLQRKNIFIPFLVANAITNIIMAIFYFWIFKAGEN